MKTKYIFIVGNSRSGTTLMAQILNNHSDVHVMRETHFYEEYIDKDYDIASIAKKKDLINKILSIQEFGIYRKNIVKNYPNEVNSIVSILQPGKNDIFDIMQQVFNLVTQKYEKEIPGDKTPRHIFYLDNILKQFSGSKALVMVRDSRGVILSQKNKYKAGKRGGQPWFEVLRTRLNYHPITASYIWIQGIKASLKFKNNKHSTRVKFVIFENLISNPQKEVTDICNFFGIEFENKMLNIYLSMSSNINMGKETQKVEGFISSVAEKWKIGLSKTEIYLCQIITKRYLEYFGYGIKHIKPNYFILFFYAMTIFPRLFVALCLNLNRMGNPFRFIIDRIFIIFRPIKNEK